MTGALARAVLNSETVSKNASVPPHRLPLPRRSRLAGLHYRAARNELFPLGLSVLMIPSHGPAAYRRGNLGCLGGQRSQLLLLSCDEPVAQPRAGHHAAPVRAHASDFDEAQVDPARRVCVRAG